MSGSMSAGPRFSDREQANGRLATMLVVASGDIVMNL